MKRLVVAFAAFLAMVAAGAAQPERTVVSYELDNGLKVALAPDATVPKVAMYLRYRVGAMHEPPGRSGFAHLFEHLMFSGTTAWPDPDVAHLGRGNRMNAWTSQDATYYYVEGISANLPMILSLEADRMANLGGEVDQSELDIQRAVVKNEMRQNVLDYAGGGGWQALWNGIFPDGHPYSRSVLGSMADLDAATLDDVRGFFNTYYVPNNAALALVGDFTIEEARALVEETFGAVPRGADVAAPEAPDPEPARLRLEVADRMPYPWLMIAHTGPREGTPESGALEIVAELLGNPEYGFLRQRLVVERNVAPAAHVEWHPGLLGGRFNVNASPLPGVDAETLEAELKAALADFLAAPFDPADVERARRTLLIQHRLDVEGYAARAEAIAHAMHVLDDARAGLADDPHVAGATVAQVEAAARAVLDPATASVAVIRPGERGNYPRVLVESTGEPQPFTAPDRPVVAVPVLDPAEPRAAEVPASEQAVLSNGVRVVHYRLPASPMAYVGVVGDGGWDNAPPGREGLLEMAAAMAVRGAGDRDFAAFARAAKDIGADIGYRAAVAGTAVTLSVPGEHFGEGVALLADAVLRPRFDAGEWRQLVSARLDRIAWDATDLGTVARHAVLDRILPATGGHPGATWTAEAVEAMTLDEARTVHSRLFQPASATVFSVGPLPLDEVAAGLEASFSGWSDTAPGFAREKRRPVILPGGLPVLVVPEPGASQSAIELVRPAPGLSEDGHAEALAVARLLGGDFLSRLNSVIREEKGYSYGVSSEVFGTVDAGSALSVSAPVERAHTGAALAEIFKGFAGLAETPPTPEELNRTVTAYQTALAGVAETGAGLFSTVLANDGIGISLDDYYARSTAVIELDIDEVRTRAGALASLERSMVVIAGDPETILPQLAAIGVEAQVLPARDDGERTRAADTELEPTAAPVFGASSAGTTGGACDGQHRCDVRP